MGNSSQIRKSWENFNYKQDKMSTVLIICPFIIYLYNSRNLFWEDVKQFEFWGNASTVISTGKQGQPATRKKKKKTKELQTHKYGNLCMFENYFTTNYLQVQPQQRFEALIIIIQSYVAIQSYVVLLSTNKVLEDRRAVICLNYDVQYLRQL